ncbi:MAG: cytochrome c biogenesis protein ResB [Nitrospiraceae bacterium]|nr:MAG: cytochrome c biogenesis protein ResB [Nitrospiraceae bacterium]
MRWLWKFLTSRNTAIVLLTAVSAILFISAALPNPALLPAYRIIELEETSPVLMKLGRNFNSMKIGRSPVFALIGILLIVSTTFCSMDRLVRKFRMRKDSGIEPDTGKKSLSVRLPGELNETQEKLVSILKNKRWKTVVSDTEGETIISAHRGNLGFWGSIFFHAILITLMAGLVAYFLSGFYASMRITEGQSLRLSKENLFTIDRMPMFGIALPQLQFQFNSFSAVYHDDFTATDFTGNFDITDEKTGMTWKKTFKINDPLTYEGIDFLMIKQGYSPNFILYKNKVLVFDALVALEFDHDNRATFNISEHGLYIVAQFFPDMAKTEDGGVYTKTYRPKNPYFGLEIFAGGKSVFRRLLGRGERGEFGPYSIAFADIRNWITINLVRETGIGFFFMCSMIGLAGLFIRVMDPDMRIIARIKNTDDGHIADFYYTGKHFEGMLREKLKNVIRNLKGDEETKEKKKVEL